jgi:hypothetical protein
LLFKNFIKSVYFHFQLNIIKQPVSRPILKTENPGNHTVLRGSNLTLKCEVVNADECYPYEIVWIKHDIGTKQFFRKNPQCLVVGSPENLWSFLATRRIINSRTILLQPINCFYYKIYNSKQLLKSFSFTYKLKYNANTVQCSKITI